MYTCRHYTLYGIAMGLRPFERKRLDRLLVNPLRTCTSCTGYRAKFGLQIKRYEQKLT